ncbi:MAG: acyl carrier protein [Anaerolineae bacterium]|nr:acyl carrier protein [Anaerolineae bacterium]
MMNYDSPLPDSPLPGPRALSFAEFQVLLAELVHAEPAQLVPEACLVTDLGVDSLRLVEIFLRLEDLGVEVSPDAVWEIETVGDAYEYYKLEIRN